MNFFLWTTPTTVEAFLVISVIFWNLFQANGVGGESCSLCIYMYAKFIVVNAILQCLVTTNTFSVLCPADKCCMIWLVHFNNLETCIIFWFIFCLLLYSCRVIRNHFCEDLHEDFFFQVILLRNKIKICWYNYALWLYVLNLFFCLFKL